MSALDWTWTALAMAALAFLLQALLTKSNKRLPPGPRGVPILGHLHLLGKNPHQDLHRLAKIHGPIMYLRFGFVPNIIVSSPQAAEQFLKEHDLVFASRPPHEAPKHMGYGQKDLIFGPYGPYWRNMRKLCTLELLSNHKINSFHPMRREEVGLLVKSIEQAAKDRVVVDLSVKVSSLSADITCRMVFGKKYTDRETIDQKGFRALIKEIVYLAGAPNLGDYFPYFGVLDFQGLTRRMKAVSKVFDEFLEKIIDEHVQDQDEGRIKDFVDTMMGIMNSGEAEFQFDRQHVKAIMLDMLVASMDTSSSAIEWILSELFKHPQVQKKVQKELKEIVGLGRMVEESDLENLEYLNMVVKEAFRLHPVAPLLIPHEAMKDCTINGLHIPRRSRVIINASAIGRDPNAWTDPEKFIPERFVGCNIDVRGRDFQLIPFGSGRRSCPGMQLGLTVVRLVVAQLVHCFDWQLPNDMLSTELDMTEEFGVVLSRAQHLLAIPTFRLHV